MNISGLQEMCKMMKLYETFAYQQQNTNCWTH